MYTNAALAQYVTKNTKIRRIAIFDDSTQYGVEGGREFAFNLENSKVKIVEHISVTDKTTDFHTDLVALQGKKSMPYIGVVWMTWQRHWLNKCENWISVRN